MDYDEAKDEAIAALSAALDKATALVRTALMGHGITTRLKKIDYVAQVIVLNFPDHQPSSEIVDIIGDEVRSLWPDGPDMNAVFFKVSKMNADLIIDLNYPSGIKQLAEQGDLKALVAIAAGTDYIPTIHYEIEQGKIKREPGMMSVHERKV